MASMSITISDTLAAKIAEHWGDNAEYKQWIKDQTREVLREAQIRAAREDANARLRTAIEAIEAADAEEVG
jgi:hypothetical protein